MNCKTFIFLMMVFLISFSSAFAQRPSFNKNKDILIACFDIRPDPDDIHAVAALGSMLAHKDLDGVNYFAVAGAYGNQGGRYLQSNSLFNMAFGNNWADAHNNRSAAIAAITSRVTPVLQNGGKVWVQEGGQSDVTADWLMPIINANNGINSTTTKNNVILVQHDDAFNEGKANQSKLRNVKNNTRYFLLDDGNAGWNDGWGNHGPWSTPMYRNRSNSFVDQAKNSPNNVAKALWTEADRIFNNYFPNGFPHDWSFFFTDGVDYSDCVENWWIFEIGSNADTHAKFWSRYVMNSTSNPDPNPNQQFFIVNRQTGKKLRPQNNSDAVTLIQVPANTTSNIVKWEQVNTSNGYFYLKNVETGKYFRPVGNNDGSALEQRPTSYSGNYTQWKKVNSSNGYFYLQNRQTNHYFRPSTDANNSPMVQRPTTYSGNYTQWKFDVVRSKSNTIEPNTLKLAIYPNPATNQLEILGMDTESNVSVKDLSGRIVIQETKITGKNMKLDVSHLQSGIYLLSIKNTLENNTIRFIKK